MLKLRQARSFAHTFPPGAHNPRHSHTWDQLLYGSGGVLTVGTDDGSWIIPPQRACWIPAGTEHSFRTMSGVDLRTLYLPEALVAGLPRRPCALNVSPLLRELILETVRLGTLEDGALLDLLLERIAAMPRVPLHLPWPRDPRARAVARRLEERLRDPDPLDDVCRGLASRRTIERLFQAETGLTLGRWRAQLRLCHAVALLAREVPVTEVADATGYATPSAFIEMFRRHLGETPSRYNRTWTEAEDRIADTPRVPVPTVIEATGERLGPEP